MMFFFWWGGEVATLPHDSVVNSVVGNPPRHVDQIFAAWVMFQLDFLFKI